MTGYCYRDTSMSLVDMPWLREALYAAIVMMQAVPVAVVILHFSPTPDISESATHCAQLSQIEGFERWRMFLMSHWQSRLAAACLLFLLSFQEADLAALMQASGWSEWMFTRHAGGLELSTTIRLTLIPILIEIPCLLPIVFWLTRPEQRMENVIHRSHKPTRISLSFSGIWIATALLVVVIIPGWQIAQGAGVGFKSLLLQPATGREIGDAVLISITTTGCVLSVIISMRRLQHFRVSQSVLSVLTFLLIMPGAVGNLALGLLLAGFFQTEALNFAYDSPVPLILGEVALILPRAFIVMQCLNRISIPASLHQLKLLAISPHRQHHQAVKSLWWQLLGRKWFAIACLIAIWAYFEVMLPSILAMPGLSPIGLVLYNHLHYGRIAALGAKLVLTLAIPVVLITSLLFLRRLLTRYLPV